MGVLERGLDSTKGLTGGTEGDSWVCGVGVGAGAVELGNTSSGAGVLSSLEGDGAVVGSGEGTEVGLGNTSSGVGVPLSRGLGRGVTVPGEEAGMG